jgi:hypothetical protein
VWFKYNYKNWKQSLNCTITNRVTLPCTVKLATGYVRDYSYYEWQCYSKGVEGI